MAIILFLMLLIFSSNTPAVTPDQPITLLVPTPDEAPLAKFIEQMLVRYDFQSISMNQAMSERIVDHYLLALDPQKLYFTEQDIELFSKDRDTLGPEIDHNDLHLPFAIFSLYQLRVIQRYALSRTLLNKGFNFTVNENLNTNREASPREKSLDDLHDLWRRLVKNDWLVHRLRGEKSADIKATLDRRYLELMNSAFKYKSEDVFQIFMDAFANAVEPHTDYLGKKAAEEFDIEMRLSLVGIGAVFQQFGDYLVISDITPGGPAALSGQLQIGDRLIGVAQGESGTLINVIGARLDDAATLVRGRKGTVVKLALIAGNADIKAKPRYVTLVRNKIVFEEAAAKKSVMPVQDGAVTRRIGVITLPSFYQDFEARNRGEQKFKSATRDVARLLAELKDEQVDGILVDLRNNGGGALDEAVGLAGLFIGKGPVVQQIDTQGHISVSNAADVTALWSGPVAVLINRRTASASEIFAAALQDYGRGIIIGETSFGKGTVQTMINLDRLLKNNASEFGQLKMTIAQFFRVNGDSTQLRGVVPDIQLPSLPNAETFSESKFDNAVPWSNVQPVPYQRATDLIDLLPRLLRNHEQRIAQDPDFTAMLKTAAKLKLQQDRHVVSLSEAIRRTARSAETDIAATDSDNLAASPPKPQARDLWLQESAHILSDESGLLQSQPLEPVPH